MQKTQISLIWCTLLICFFTNISAQNLVTNSDFEIGSCPPAQGHIDEFGVNVPPWVSPSPVATTDYIHTCGGPGVQPTNCAFGNRAPRSGNGMGGILIKNAVPNRREYLQLRLSCPMVAGQDYDIGGYFLTGDGRYVTNSLGFYISQTAPWRADWFPIVATPQITAGGWVFDKVNWTLISGTYTATGGEEYITIGVFLDDANMPLGDFGFGFNGMYYFVEDVYCMGPCPLPVEMEELTVEEGPNNTVLCSWTTINEKNNDYFEIERSRDGINYETISRVQGNGNSSEWIEYRSYDEHPLNGLVYYRLKQVDYNGAEKHNDPVVYSKKRMKVKGRLYPNPFENELVISNLGSEGEVKIIILNALGQVVYCSVEPCKDEIKKDFSSDFPPGQYILKVIKGEEQFIEKIIKE